MKVIDLGFAKSLFFIAVLSLLHSACLDDDHVTKTSPERGSTASSPKTVLPGTKVRIAVDGGSVLFCKDPARMDFAMDAAKMGNEYDAREALRHDYFFSVTGPAWIEVKESEMQSRWPKVYATILDGDSAGRSGWVLFSELKDLEKPAR